MYKYCVVTLRITISIQFHTIQDNKIIYTFYISIHTQKFVYLMEQLVEFRAIQNKFISSIWAGKILNTRQDDFMNEYIGTVA